MPSFSSLSLWLYLPRVFADGPNRLGCYVRLVGQVSWVFMLGYPSLAGPEVGSSFGFALACGQSLVVLQLAATPRARSSPKSTGAAVMCGLCGCQGGSHKPNPVSSRILLFKDCAGLGCSRVYGSAALQKALGFLRLRLAQRIRHHLEAVRDIQAVAPREPNMA